jgi:hypothetical protein
LHISNNLGIQGNGFTFGIAPKVTKSLGPKPPKAKRPGGYRGCGVAVSLLKPGIDLGSPCFIRTFSLSKPINSDTLKRNEIIPQWNNLINLF